MSFEKSPFAFKCADVEPKEFVFVLFAEEWTVFFSSSIVNVRKSLFCGIKVIGHLDVMQTNDKEEIKKRDRLGTSLKKIGQLFLSQEIIRSIE